MIFSPCHSRQIFLGERERREEKRNCRLRRKEETHTHTPFLFFGGKKDEEKKNSDVRVVVQNASFVFIINFFVRRAEWAYSQRSLSVFNSLPTLHT